MDDFVLPLDWWGAAAADDESWDDMVTAAASVLLRWSQRDGLSGCATGYLWFRQRRRGLQTSAELCRGVSPCV